MSFFLTNSQMAADARNVEDESELRVGAYYLVNVVSTIPDSRSWQGFSVPVLGPLHEDAQTIGFPWAHYHVDWRFVPQTRVDLMERTLKREFAQHPSQHPPYRNPLL